MDVEDSSSSTSSSSSSSSSSSTSLVSSLHPAYGRRVTSMWKQWDHEEDPTSCLRPHFVSADLVPETTNNSNHVFHRFAYIQVWFNYFVIQMLLLVLYDENKNSDASKPSEDSKFVRFAQLMREAYAVVRSEEETMKAIEAGIWIEVHPFNSSLYQDGYAYILNLRWPSTFVFQNPKQSPLYGLFYAQFENLAIRFAFELALSGIKSLVCGSDSLLVHAQRIEAIAPIVCNRSFLGLQVLDIIRRLPLYPRYEKQTNYLLIGMAVHRAFNGYMWVGDKIRDDANEDMRRRGLCCRAAIAFIKRFPPNLSAFSTESSSSSSLSSLSSSSSSSSSTETTSNVEYSMMGRVLTALGLPEQAKIGHEEVFQLVDVSTQAYVDEHSRTPTTNERDTMFGSFGDLYSPILFQSIVRRPSELKSVEWIGLFFVGSAFQQQLLYDAKCAELLGVLAESNVNDDVCGVVKKYIESNAFDSDDVKERRKKKDEQDRNQKHKEERDEEDEDEHEDGYETSSSSSSSSKRRG
jgi:hypothetical protein